MNRFSSKTVVITIIAGVSVLLIFFGMIFLTKVSSSSPSTAGPTIKESQSIGDISMKNGIREIPFRFSNTTETPIRITNLSTTCMCTKAKLVIDGKESFLAGMPGGHGGVGPINPRMTLQPGQTADVLALYDPNAHGPSATGPITRSVIAETDSPTLSKFEFTFSGVVVK